ncbi:hypothetical protein CPC08DRAFT_787068 [Agrocybe pediades]|nr:hypothetical protein CPC08DRAFT_787068 [Agrocybe pediades]
MVFRVPSQSVDDLVPAPSLQNSQPPPWRGSMIVSGMRSSDRGSSQEIWVTAVETDGEKYVEAIRQENILMVEMWPRTFHVRVLHEQPVLREFQAWVLSYRPAIPLCTFMPGRTSDQNAHTVNQANFRSLSRVLFAHNAIAIASWPPNTFPGAGMIIYPAQNSTAVLVGALFFEMSFPSFIGGVPSPISPVSPLSMQQVPRHPQYTQQRISNISPYSASPHRHAPSLSPHLSDPNSPVEQAIAAHTRQEAYRYMMPRPGQAPYNTMPQPSVSPEAGWTGKDEDEKGYAAYHQQHPPYS